MKLRRLRPGFPRVPLRDAPGAWQHTNTHVRRVCAALFLICFVIFLAGAGGHLYSGDEETMYSTTEALVKSHRLALSDEMVQDRRVAAVPGRDGKLYGVYGILPSIAAIPLFVAGEGVASFYPEHFRPYILRLFVSFSNSFITALTCVLIFLFALRLFQSRMIAYWIVASYAVGSMALQYAKTFFSEPLCTLFLLLAAYFALLAGGGEKNKTRAVIAGFALGAAVLTKSPSLIFVPIFGIYLWLKSSPLHKHGLAITVNFCLGLLPPLLGYLLLQHSHFGTFFDSPYRQLGPAINFRTPLYFGLDGLLLSSGKGFLFYFPLSLLAIPALVRLQHEHFAEAVLFAGIFVTDVLFYSTYSFWYGGNCWGPRFLFFSIPFVALSLGAYLQQVSGKRAGAYLFLALFLSSVGVQLGGALIYFNQYISILRVPAYERAPTYQSMVTMNFNPKFSPIVGHWKLAVHDWKNRSKLREYLREPRIVPLGDNGGKSEATVAGHEAPFVWTSATSRFALVPGRPLSSSSIDVALDTNVPVQPAVRFEINGEPTTPVAEWKEGPLSLYRLPLRGKPEGPEWLTISSHTWVPAEHTPGSQDHRRLGVALFFVREGGQVIGWKDWQDLGTPRWALPLPSAPIYLLGWFWLPVLDFWWIFAAFAGLPHGFIAFTSLMVLLLGCGAAFLSSRLIAQPLVRAWPGGDAPCSVSAQAPRSQSTAQQAAGTKAR